MGGFFLLEMCFSREFSTIRSSVIAALKHQTARLQCDSVRCSRRSILDDVVIGRIRAEEVTAGDVSHGSHSVDGLM